MLRSLKLKLGVGSSILLSKAEYECNSDPQPNDPKANRGGCIAARGDDRSMSMPCVSLCVLRQLSDQLIIRGKGTCNCRLKAARGTVGAADWEDTGRFPSIGLQYTRCEFCCPDTGILESELPQIDMLRLRMPCLDAQSQYPIVFWLPRAPDGLAGGGETPPR